jgi:hypothetical protein
MQSRCSARLIPGVIGMVIVGVLSALIDHFVRD